MNKEITIVTAFFNLNRENWDKFERSEKQYFGYFTQWARLKNNIIVYVESEKMKKKVFSFRKSLGLENNTIINLVSDYKSIDPELYGSIVTATKNKVQQNFRMMKKNPEVWNADYNYVMLLKMWCVQDAVAKKQATGMVAWIDFGYNHGGEVIDKKSDFNFLWSYDFPEKINLFLVRELDNRPIFDIIRTMDTYIVGTVIVGKAELWNTFWIMMRDSMIALNESGLTDDDQNIILMCYRKNPDIFSLHKSGWQRPMMQFGGEHLLPVKASWKEKSIIWKTLRSIRKMGQDLRYAWLTFCQVHKARIN